MGGKRTARRRGTSSGWRGRGLIGGLSAVTAIALAACGSVPSGDSLEVLRLSSGASGEAVTEMARASGDDIAPGTLGFAPVEYRFELADSARLEAGEATAWRLEPPADLRAEASELAAHLGLGEVGESPHGGGSLFAGADDGSGPSLWVGAGGDWSYHDPTGHRALGCAEPGYPGVDGGDIDARPVPDDREAPDSTTGTAPDDPAAPDSATGDAANDSTTGRVTTEPAPADGEPRDGDADREALFESRRAGCEPPAPPENVPDEAETEALATELFEAIGVPGSLRGVDATANEWGAWAQARLEVGGQEVALHYAASYGGDARLLSANGTLARLVEVGDYPTVDADEALERLREQPWLGGMWRPMPHLRGDQPAVSGFATTPDEPVSSDDVAEPTEPLPLPDATEEPDETDPAEGDDVAEPAEPGDGAEPAEPAEPTEPVEPTEPAEPTEPEVVSVTLVEVESSLAMVVDADGLLWLVPAYLFSDDQGGEWQTLAIAEDYLDVAIDVPEPAIEPAPAEEDPPMADPGDGRDETDKPTDIEALASEVVGLSEQDATERLEAAGVTVRVVERDGEQFPVTMDYRPDRVNLRVTDGRVTEAKVG